MGRVSGAVKCVKYLLCAFNFIFWLAGAAVVAVGLYLRFEGSITKLPLKDQPSSYFPALYVLIGAGALMMVVGFFGCCGAARESQCLLGSFFACLLVIFAAEMTAGLVVFIGNSESVDGLEQGYKAAFDKYVSGDGESNSTLIAIHHIFDCCGQGSAEPVKDLCVKDIKEPKNCLEEIKRYMTDDLKVVGILAIATAGITVFGMIFSMVLCCAIRNSQDVI